MKSVPTTIFWAIKNGLPKHSQSFLLQFSAMLTGLFVCYGVLFQLLMYYEERSYSWITGFYWVLVTMSTLGYGDIVFFSDPGKIFSIVVNLSGLITIIILLPIVIIEFVYTPFMKMQREFNAPRSLPEKFKNHVIILELDAVAESLIHSLERQGIQYVVLVKDPEDGAKLRDRGLSIMVGDIDLPSTYEKARIKEAALVAVNTPSDPMNTNAVFSIRQLEPHIPIVAVANYLDANNILELAGSTRVLDISSVMGRAMARCSASGTSNAHVMHTIEQLLIVEARASGTSLVGKNLKELEIGKRFGITVVGVWERGKFELGGPATEITEHSVLVMGATQEQLELFNEHFTSPVPVVGHSSYILGAGRVGVCTAKALKKRGVPFTLIDMVEKKTLPEEFKQDLIVGDAADAEFLKSSGFYEARSILITTHDDNINIYLTIFFRKLRPDAHIVARSSQERNVTTLHQAGADFVLSSATMAATAIYNQLHKNEVFILMEGLFAKCVEAPPSMIGHSLYDLQFRVLTGCSVIAIKKNGTLEVNPSPFAPIAAGSKLIMVLTPEGDERFNRYFCSV